jgi:hypothetical protein
MSSVEAAFGIASLDEQVRLNFRPFPDRPGSAISLLRTVPCGTNSASFGWRSGLPAPLNRLDRKRRPAPLPGPAAHRSLASGAECRAVGPVPALLRQSIGNRRVGRPTRPLVADKRRISFPPHYRSHPAPHVRVRRSDLPDWRPIVLARPRDRAPRPEQNVLNSSR